MTSQTVGNAVAHRDKELQLINWLRSQQDDLAMAAASHLKPSTIVRVAQGALRKDPKLMAAAIANPQSLIHCLLDAARLGHEPGTDQYWLIPFGQEVTGIEGYKGIIERMYRAGGVSVVVAEVVRQKDHYRSMGPTTPPVHEFDEFADPAERGELRGTYAYALMTDGACSQVIRLGRAEVMKHKAMSRGADRSDSPWQKWEESMWKKTPLRGLEPYVPTSSEWLQSRAQAAATASARVVAPGWTPSGAVQPAAAPLQLVASEVIEPEPQNVPPAETPAEPPQRPAGGTTTSGERVAALIASGQLSQLQTHRERLGYSDSEEDWEAWLADLAKLAGLAAIASPGELTQEEAAKVIKRLKVVPDGGRQALTDLLRDGVVPGE